MSETNAIQSSGAVDPYKKQTYSMPSNDKNTLTIESYFKLLAAQLANQDMTNPMDNSELMTQMVQMAMVQSLGTVTESLTTSSTVTTQTYAASLIGQDVTVALTKEEGGVEIAYDVLYGKVESVDFTGGDPVLKLEGSDKQFSLSHLLGMGKIKNPYEAKEEEGEGDSDPKE